MTPEQKQRHLRTIEKIENTPRPEKWREIRKFYLKLHPELVEVDREFSQACKEIRQASESKTGASKSLSMRNTMKLPNYVYRALTQLDPEIMIEMSGRNHGEQWRVGKQLYQAFPMYRIAREY